MDASAADAASRDATPADAAPPDAAPADAAPRDAAPPDAFIPDAFVGPRATPCACTTSRPAARHNSYHMRPQMVFHPSHDYSHAPLDVQVGDQGVRQLELDLRKDPERLRRLHLPLIDPETVCYAFEDCLRTLDRWSRTHQATCRSSSGSSPGRRLCAGERPRPERRPDERAGRRHPGDSLA
ncbi:MAG: hypothetical protein R3F43_17505 [bacterium]